MKTDHFLSRLSRYFLSLTPSKISEPQKPTTPTSIRLTADINDSLTKYSNLLDIPKSTLINQILSQAFFAEDISSLISDELNIIEDRIWYLFDSHKLKKTDVLSLINDCRALNGELPVTLLDLPNIIKLVNTDLIDYLADFFVINPDWLLGLSDKMAGTDYNWYREPVETIKKIIEAYQNDSNSRLYMLKDDSLSLTNAVDKEDLTKEGKSGANLSIVLTTSKKLPNGKSTLIAIPHNYSVGQRWSYYKTRRAFKVIYLAAEQIKYTLPIGFTLAKDDLNRITSGDRAAIELHTSNQNKLSKQLWHIEDYVSSTKFVADKEKEEADIIVDSFNNNRPLLQLFVDSGLYPSIEEVKITPPEDRG